MATFWETAAKSVNHIFLFVILVVSPLGFDCCTLVLIAPVPDPCRYFTSIRHNYEIIMKIHISSIRKLKFATLLNRIFSNQNSK